MKPKILLTTPDYPPSKIGGISTFVINLESCLKRMDLDYELFVWNSPREIKAKNPQEYQFVINAHYLFSYFHPSDKNINFIHGGEILAYSPNFFKRIFKKIKHKKILKKLHLSKFNIFVSGYSFQLFNELSTVDYGRDLVFENKIDTSLAQKTAKNWNEDINLCCFVRDVPHKNIDGTIRFYQKLKERHPHRVKLYITAQRNYADKDIICIPGVTDDDREEVLKKCHLNLLFSLDHSKIGNIEGFGLTVLEAGKYGVPSLGLSHGGLRSSIHHHDTGWLFNDKFESFDSFYRYFSLHYNKLSLTTYQHTLSSHSSVLYDDLLRRIL